MVGVGGASAADQTRVRRHKLEVGFVAVAARLADSEETFVNFCGSSVGLKRCRSGTRSKGAISPYARRREGRLEKAGVEFIPENGGGAGVRLHKPNGRMRLHD
jgi:hypothetical protein